MLLDRYITAFEKGDSAAIREVIHDDFSLEAVPHPVWFKGVHVCIPFMERNFSARSWHVRMLPTRANGQPAMAGYRQDDDGVLRADCLWVLTLVDGRFSRATKFEGAGLVTAAGFPAQYSETFPVARS